MPVTRQRISRSTEGRASGEERPGDHGACGWVGTPGAGGAHEGVSGFVPGDHGACAQGRMPITRQWILPSMGARIGLGQDERLAGRSRRAPTGHEVIMGVRSGPDAPYTATDPPIDRRPCAAGERRGDHRTCGRVGTPGAGGAHEGVSGPCRVIMGRALRAAHPSRGNGFSHRSECGSGWARTSVWPGGAGGHQRGMR